MPRALEHCTPSLSKAWQDKRGEAGVYLIEWQIDSRNKHNPLFAVCLILYSVDLCPRLCEVNQSPDGLWLQGASKRSSINVTEKYINSGL